MKKIKNQKIQKAKAMLQIKVKKILQFKIIINSLMKKYSHQVDNYLKTNKTLAAAMILLKK